MNLSITQHAFERASQRFGWNEKETRERILLMLNTHKNIPQGDSSLIDGFAIFTVHSNGDEIIVLTIYPVGGIKMFRTRYNVDGKPTYRRR